MALSKYKLGDLIEQRREKFNCIDVLPIRGVSREGFIFPKQDAEDFSIYNVFYKNDFVFNPARMELNSIALNVDLEKGICSSLYEIFYVKRTDILLPEYLNLFIKREEFARICWFNAIGSARNYFRVGDLGKIEILIPNISIQRKYIEIYNSMIANQKTYEKGLMDLKLVCDDYIENLKKDIKLETIGPYIELIKDRNSDDKIKNVFGVSNTLNFIKASSSVDKDNLTNYKIVNYKDLAYVPTTHMKIWAVAISDKKDPFVVSPIYEVFRVIDKTKLFPEYLFIWLCRKETIRYAYYNSWGSARENFVFDDLKTIKMPIPSIEVQRSIVEIYQAYKMRMKINDKLKKQIQNICPILIKGSIEEALKK